jgi:hypothetical protein
MDDMLDVTVLRSGLMDGVCVVLFEVGVVLFSESSVPLRLFLSVVRACLFEEATID